MTQRMVGAFLGVGALLMVGCGGKAEGARTNSGGNGAENAAGGDAGGAGGTSSGGHAGEVGRGGSLVGGAGSDSGTGGSLAGSGSAGLEETGGAAGSVGAAGTAGSGGAGGIAGGGAAGSGGAGGVTDNGGAAGISGNGGAAGITGNSGAGGNANCEALSRAIADDLSSDTCSAVVRLSYETDEILGFQLTCGNFADVTESSARQTAENDTGYGLAATLLDAYHDDEFVFYESPSDFGGVGVVNGRNGLTVFGGSIVWSGNGDITYPTDWVAAERLGADCVPRFNSLPPSGRGIDLTGGQASLESSEVEAAIDLVWNTALTDGLLEVYDAYDALVLLYPRTVGAFDPTRAEWIVIINIGILV